MTDELDDFVDRVKNRAGHSDLATVAQAVRTTLLALGGHLGGLPPALHDALPPAMRARFATGRGFEPMRPAMLYQRVAEEGELRVGVALELVQSTMAELSKLLVEPTRELLRESLPPAWAALVIEPGERSRPRVGAKRPEAREHTLAAGRPGGTRPLAEASLPGGQADSIATAADPHAARLATAKGPGPREHERTLADARPGSRHAVADGD